MGVLGTESKSSVRATSVLTMESSLQALIKQLKNFHFRHFVCLFH